MIKQRIGIPVNSFMSLAKQCQKKIIYIFAPHPDDETLACGGTIASKVRQGYEVKIIVMTNGRGSHGSYDNPLLERLVETREQESRTAVSILGASSSHISFLRYDDRSLKSVKQSAEEKVGTLLGPDIGLTQEVYFPHTYDSHPDHIATYEIVSKVLNSLNYSGKRFMYMVWGDIGKLFFSQMVSNEISGFLDIKKKAIEAYKSQVGCFLPEQKKPNLSRSFLSDFERPSEDFFVYRNELTPYYPPGFPDITVHDNRLYERFSQIHRVAKWRKTETISGVGSRVRYTKKIRQVIQDIFDRNNQGKQLIFSDLGCGDCNWIKEVNLRGSLYIGMDIVPGIIFTNILNYRNMGMSFQLADITKSELPCSDYILCKDILTHLPFADIFAILKHIYNSRSKYLIAYSDIHTETNKDCRPGDWRKLDLTKEPFNFPRPDTIYEEYHYENHFAIWDIQELAQLSSQAIGE